MFTRDPPMYECGREITKCMNNADVDIFDKVIENYTYNLNQCELSRKALLKYVE